MTELKERELENNYPVYGGYLYICDGNIFESPLHGSTVAELKARFKFTSVKNCDIFGRHELYKEKDKEDNHQKCLHCGAYTDECMCDGGRT